jgi:hypothetical protein
MTPRRQRDGESNCFPSELRIKQVIYRKVENWFNKLRDIVSMFVDDEA